MEKLIQHAPHKPPSTYGQNDRAHISVQSSCLMKRRHRDQPKNMPKTAPYSCLAWVCRFKDGSTSANVQNNPSMLQRCPPFREREHRGVASGLHLSECRNRAGPP
mmetsp:Transcript_93876/g.186191  ORF Transcript_93876/g.186191 Transcript_93876/m.186191 type:complete len:105 (+) Transcript_93876:312-626(+)